jgi:uncharacterized protein
MFLSEVKGLRKRILKMSLSKNLKSSFEPRFSKLSKILAFIPVLLIDVYRLILSPILGHRCRFSPTCSQFSREAFLTFGIFKGSLKTIHRLSKCQPWGAFGYDPVIRSENLSARSQD